MIRRINTMFREMRSYDSIKVEDVWVGEMPIFVQSNTQLLPCGSLVSTL